MCDDHYVKKSSTPATCTQDEQIIYECSVCHRIKTEVGEKKTGHDYVVDSPKVDATCETAGKTEVKKCKNCGDTIGGDVIPALKHNYLLETEKQEATCTADGKEAVYKCSKCGKHTGGEVIKATGHNYQYFEAEKKIVCSRCGDEKKVDTSYTVPSGYTLVETVPPKCTEIGYTLYKNSEGKEFYNDIKSPTGHQYGEATVHPATCTEDEYSVRICSVCNHKDVVTKEGTKLGHSYIKNVVAPTCTEQGYTIYKCETCGETKKADFVNAKGHDFSNNAQFCLNGCGTANPNYVAPDPSTAQTGSCGDNVIYSLNTETGVLTISGTGDMADYSLDNDSPFRQNSSIIKSVIIENGVTSIGNYSFSGCANLINITIPNSVTSIGSYAFSDCTSLTSVTIGNSVTSIGSSAFYNTAYYNDKSNWDNGVLYLSNCLIDTNNDFDSTTDYTIKDGTRIIANHVFSNYTKLKSIIIPDSVTTIGDYAFYECTNLTNATIGNGVTSIGERAFNECTNLASITIPDSVISIGDWAFSDCKSLKSVTIGNDVTNIGSSAFYGCNNLTNITIPDSVTNIGD